MLGCRGPAPCLKSCWNDQVSCCRFSICGQISIIRSPDTVKQMSKYKVVLSSQDKDKSLVTVETDAHGSFCFKAKPGTYKVQVRVCLTISAGWEGDCQESACPASMRTFDPWSPLKGGCAGIGLSFPCRGGRGRQIPEAHWLARLAC